jgi:hypothetical protein
MLKTTPEINVVDCDRALIVTKMHAVSRIDFSILVGRFIRIVNSKIQDIPSPNEPEQRLF